jgi:ABC-2 type transport system permease protein
VNLENVRIVMSKELKEIASNKQTFITPIIFSVLFAVTNLGSVTSASVPGQPVSIDWNIMYLSMFIGVFSSFIISGTVFFREKQSGVVETLLCTPLSMREIWLGKVIGVTIPSYLCALFSAGMLAVFSSLVVSSIATPSLLIVLHLIVVAPLFTAAAVGIVGYVQFAMGMRENRLISMGVFFLLIIGLSISTGIVQGDAGLIGTVVAVLFVAAAVLLGLAYVLSNRLNKEKIIVSIPD